MILSPQDGSGAWQQGPGLSVILRKLQNLLKTSFKQKDRNGVLCVV